MSHPHDRVLAILPVLEDSQSAVKKHNAVMQQSLWDNSNRSISQLLSWSWDFRSRCSSVMPEREALSHCSWAPALLHLALASCWTVNDKLQTPALDFRSTLDVLGHLCNWNTNSDNIPRLLFSDALQWLYMVCADDMFTPGCSSNSHSRTCLNFSCYCQGRKTHSRGWW